jgi:hypothetical protein
MEYQGEGRPMKLQANSRNPGLMLADASVATVATSVNTAAQAPGAVNNIRRPWRGRTTVLAALVGLLAMLLPALAGVAIAHTPSASFQCVSGTPTLQVDLTNYNAGYTNRVSVTIDGVNDATYFNYSFGTTFHHTWTPSPSTSSHAATVVVLAGDDPTNANGYSPTYRLSVPACTSPASPTPTLTQPPTQSPRPTPTPVVTATPVVTSTPTQSPPPTPTVSPSLSPTPAPNQSFRGETAAPTVTADPTGTADPHQTFLGETGAPGTTPAPTSSLDGLIGSTATPLLALMICLSFAGIGLMAVGAQRMRM